MATVDISWEKDAWTGDDGPFANARRAIDNAFRSNTDLTKIISEYSFDAKANPQDSLDQFKWAYAFYLQGSIPHQEERNITPVLQGLIFAKQPLTYNYARLRLLCTIAGPGDRSLEERLLARDPSDTPVLYRYAFSLSQSNSREDVEKAIKVGQKLLSSGQD